MRCNGKHHRFGCDLLDVSDAGALTATFKERRRSLSTNDHSCARSRSEADLGVHTWRSRSRAAERYLSQIAIWGYDLSETEQSVIKDDSDE